jgi:hypothetical protein
MSICSVRCFLNSCFLLFFAAMHASLFDMILLCLSKFQFEVSLGFHSLKLFSTLVECFSL